jgi:hypothetical protein
MTGTCGHCVNGLIGLILCPHCWGTTVSAKSLAEAKAELARLRDAYKAKKEANKALNGRARGMAGQALSKIGDVGRALGAEVEQVERQVAANRAMARMLGAAAAE